MFMCNLLYVASDLSFLIIVLLLMAVPFGLLVWLLVEIIRWLRRH